jgi:hypothetical protein
MAVKEIVAAYQLAIEVIWNENSLDIQPDIFGFRVHYLFVAKWCHSQHFNVLKIEGLLSALLFRKGVDASYMYNTIIPQAEIVRLSQI